MRAKVFPFLLVIAGLLLASCAPAPSNPPAAAAGGAVPQTGATIPPAASTTGSAVPSGAVTFVMVPGKNEADYRVREQLARMNFPTDAVGKTSSVTGQVVVSPDSSIDSSASKFTVDATSLQTDQAMRDNFVRRNVLQTDQYPQIVFVPTQVSGLPATLPASGDVSFKLTGNLTIRDVTKPVTWDVTGKINNGEATGTATTSFTFEDFNITQPRVPVVLSVADKITLEMTLDLQQAGKVTK